MNVLGSKEEVGSAGEEYPPHTHFGINQSQPRDPTVCY